MSLFRKSSVMSLEMKMCVSVRLSECQCKAHVHYCLYKWWEDCEGRERYEGKKEKPIFPPIFIRDS